MTWLALNTTPRSRGAKRPRCSKIIRPGIKRAQGMPGARCTRGLVCKRVVRRTRAYRAAESIRHSLRNGLTAYAELSPETNSSCLRHRRIEGLSKTRLGRRTSAGLTPATGARTTRFCRTQPTGFRLEASPGTPVSALRFIRISAPVVCALCPLTDIKPALRPPRAPDAAASTATRPSFVTMANAPLGGTGWARDVLVIWGWRQG